MTNSTTKGGLLTFRLAFMSSMLSLEIMSGFVPVMGLALGMLPFILVWVVSGLRFSLIMEGLSLLFQFPSIVVYSSSGVVTSQVVSNPDWLNWLRNWFASIPRTEGLIIEIVFFGALLLYNLYMFHFLVQIMRVNKRLRPILARLGAIEPS
jgi:hypothetical protein